MQSFKLKLIEQKYRVFQMLLPTDSQSFENFEIDPENGVVYPRSWLDAFLIQSYAFERRAYIPGFFSLAHPAPHDTTPAEIGLINAKNCKSYLGKWNFSWR